MTNYYVYYRIAAGREALLRAEVQEIIGQIEKQFGIRGRWMRRRDDPLTCMEVYEGVTDETAFERALASASAPLGLERKVERFVAA